MESKKWIWIVIACLVIVTVYQVVKIAGVDPAEPKAPQKEPILQPDRQTTQTASLGGLSGMPEEKTPQVVEPAIVEEQERASEPPEPEEEDSSPMPEEEQKDAEETAEEQNPPAPETEQSDEDGEASSTLDTDQPAQEGGQAPFDGMTPPKGASPKGLVRGIVYSDSSGSVLIDDTIVHTGDTIDGVKIIRVHSGGVDFEKDGRRWTQKVSETPDPLWQ